jgi:hypothetical protein
MHRRLRGLPPVLVLLGGGVFVAVGIGAWRYLRSRKPASADGSDADELLLEPGPMPVAALPASTADGPPPTVAASVLPQSRDPQDVVEGLVPTELAQESNLRLDLLIAAAVIVAAIAVVLLVSGSLG